MTTRIPPSVGTWRIGRRIASGHEGAVLSVAFAEVRSRPLVVSGGEDGSIRRCDGLDGSSMGAPILVGSTPVHSVNLFELQGVPVIGAASGDGSIRVFNAIEGAVVSAPMWGHDGAVRSIAATSIDGVPVMVSGGIDGSVRRFDLGSMQEIGEPLSEQTGAVLSVSVGAVGDQLLIASGGSDGLVRRFDARTGALVGEPMEGHTRAVRSTLFIDLAGQPTIVTGSSDGSVRRFDAREATLIGEPVVLHSGGIRSIAIGRLGETQVIVSAGSDGTLCCLDASSGRILGERLTGHTGQVGAVAALPGSSVLVSGGDDGAIVLWRPTDGLLDERRLSVTPRLVSDVASDTDLLDLQPTASALIDFLAHPQTAAPLSVAVKGPWGAGKSTLMRLVRDGLDPVGADGTRSRIRLAGSSRTELGARPTSAWRFLRRASSKRGLTTGNVFVEAGRPNGQVPAVTDVGRRITVWFNPWSYQSGEQVWAGFAHELAEQVSGRLPRRRRELFWLRLNLARVDRSAVRRSFYQSVFERAIKPAAALVVVAAILLASGLVEGAIAVLTGGVAAAVAATAGIQWGRPASSLYQTLVGGSVYDRVRAARDSLAGLEKYAPDPDYGARSGYVHLIQTDVQRVVKLAATPERPLVVFVDDLDRCAPGTVLQVLEAINLFLAGELEGCIFVLGIEPTMLAAHIETDYEALIGSLRRRDPRLRGEDMSWKFLEKLIQLSVRVPDPTDRGLSELLDWLIGHEVDDRPPEVPADLEAEHREPNSEPAIAGGGAGAGRPLDSRPTGGVGPGTSIDPAVAARARRAIATSRVQELLTFEDPRVRAMVAERVRAITRNPRGVKRVINLFVFHSYLAAARGLLPVSDDALVADLAKILDLAELLIRWPEFTERLAARDEDGTTALVILAAAAAPSGGAAWNEALRQFGLIAREPGAVGDGTSEAAREEPAPPVHDVPTDLLRSFLHQASDSVTMMSELI